MSICLSDCVNVMNDQGLDPLTALRWKYNLVWTQNPYDPKVLCTYNMANASFAKLKIYINPFTAPACNISGLKDSSTRLQTVQFQVLWHLLLMLCVSMKIHSHASAKKETEIVKGFTFALLLVVFKWNRGSEGVKANESLCDRSMFWFDLCRFTAGWC